jgi:hypothetical protein
MINGLEDGATSSKEGHIYHGLEPNRPFTAFMCQNWTAVELRNSPTSPLLPCSGRTRADGSKGANNSWDPRRQAILGNLKALGEREDGVAVVSAHPDRMLALQL